jgi:hypothetical protein
MTNEIKAAEMNDDLWGLWITTETWWAGSDGAAWTGTREQAERLASRPPSVPGPQFVDCQPYPYDPNREPVSTVVSSEIRDAIITAAEELRSGERSHTDVANWLLDLDARLRGEARARLTAGRRST